MSPEVLEQIPLFAEIGDQERQIVAGLAEDIAVSAGQRLILEGDFGYQFFAIREGRAAVTRDGERVSELGPGDVFGEIGLMVTGRRTASVTALTPMRLVVLFARDFHRIERLLPDLGKLLRAECWNRLTPRESA